MSCIDVGGVEANMRLRNLAFHELRFRKKASDNEEPETSPLVRIPQFVPTFAADFGSGWSAANCQR